MAASYHTTAALARRQCHLPQADLAKRKLSLSLLINGIGGLGIVIVLVLLGWAIRVIMW